MRDTPPVAESEILSAVERGYGLRAVGLEFLPIGNDIASFVYRLDADDGARYFLKLRAGRGFNQASLQVPRFLVDNGLPHVLAPLRTQNDGLWIDADGFALSLFPFLDARRAADGGMSEAQWREFGGTVRGLHDLVVPKELELLLPSELFMPKQRELIETLDAIAAQGGKADAVSQDFVARWNERRELIRRLVGRADELGRELRQENANFVLCHADMHPWNVLVEPTGHFWLVDWDETRMALPERDLMFVLGGMGGDGITAHVGELFLEGYGAETISQRALTYYRYAWAVSDIAAYGEQAVLLPELSAEARRDGVEGLVSLFAPGAIVDKAVRSDTAVELH